MFGVSLGVDVENAVRVGDPVYAKRKTSWEIYPIVWFPFSKFDKLLYIIILCKILESKSLASFLP